MTLAYIIPGGFNDGPGVGRELYQGYASVRRFYDQVGEWTSYQVDEILDGEFPGEPEVRHSVGSIRQAAAVMGCHDVLAESGIRPAAVAGLSMGSLVGGALAGAVDRGDLFSMLARGRDIPPLPEDAPEQAIAVVTLPAGHDLGEYYDGGLPDVYLAADLGPTGSGAKRELFMSGYRSALDQLATQLPPGVVQVLEHPRAAFHSPLRRHVADFFEPYVRAIPFRAPAVPLLAGLEPKLLTTASDVRDVFLRNSVDPVSIVHISTVLERLGTELGVVLGPVGTDFSEKFPFPVVYVEEPEQVTELLTTIYELGIEIPRATSGRDT